MKTRIPLLLGALAGGTLAYQTRVRRGKQAVERFAAAALETLLNAIEANDEETGMHVRRVAACALIIADAAGLSESEKRAIERVALFHDIGKIHEALFDIVHEPKRLTPSERRAVATHPARGAEVLAPLAAFYPELPSGVIAHHERWDGKGYPRGLKGRRIPLEARIVTIADTFDAVTHSRRYRGASDIAYAIQVLEAGRGTQFDPELVDLTLLPPVIAEMARVRIETGGRHQARRSARREAVPDVSFRWRSASLGAARVVAPREIE
jgi:HD-GYP domain-containing protein (c-di-GMP phosphodiesterase class II)